MLDTLELPFLFSCLSMLRRSTPFCLYRWSYAQEMETLNVHVSCVCVCSVCACVWDSVGRWGGETGYVGNNTKHKKCHMIWNTGLIYLASERICCMWFGGENVFPLCSQCAQTQHMETFSERPWVCEKKVPDILFLLPLFIAFFSSFFFFSWTDWITYICLPHVEISP